MANKVPSKFAKRSKDWKDLFGIIKCDSSKNNDNIIRKIKIFLKPVWFK